MKLNHLLLQILIALVATISFANHALAEGAQGEFPPLGDGSFMYEGQLYYADAWLDEDLGLCWQTILETQPWISKDQIACIEAGDGFALAYVALCAADPNKITDDFSAYVEYTRESIRISEAMGTAQTEKDWATHSRLSLEFERLEQQWRLSYSRQVVYRPLSWLSSRSISSECAN